MDNRPPAPSLVNGERLLRRLAQLRQVGASEHGGVTRLAFSPADLEARGLVGRWMIDAGLTVETDAATNLIGRSAIGPGAIVSGSHLDTVVNGGWLDGAYGVVAAIEVAQSLRDAGHQLIHPYVCIAFANEEGANGTVAFTGSHALAGHPDAIETDRADDDGIALHDRIRTAGGEPERMASAALQPGDIAAMVELHIEQGPVLEHEGATIGVVEGITGRGNVLVAIQGTANHAGTTPMDLRHDAAVAAARIILEIDDLARSGWVRTATSGHIQIRPNVRNVVPGEAVIACDIRDIDVRRIDEAIVELQRRCGEVATATATAIELSIEARLVGAACDPLLMKLITDSTVSLGLSHRALTSGAGHDSQVMAHLTPIGMVFVPSIGGVSHNPTEDTRPDDLVAGANVLLRTIVSFDNTA